jgi:hypothetical protein
MDLYPWIVLVHVGGVMLFFIAHGASAMVGIRLRTERDPTRVAALLDLSRWSMGKTAGISLLIGFVAGIVAGFVGGWWGHLWIWLALALLVAIAFAMTPLTPLAEQKLHQMRRALGMGIGSPFGLSPIHPPRQAANPEELQRLLEAWDPIPSTVIGFAGFVAILALMLLKPF